MQLTIQREAFLKPLQQVISVVERRKTIPVLGNLLLRVAENSLFMTGTDSEVEILASVTVQNQDDYAITIPARKCFDLVRALPDGSNIQLSLNGDRIVLKTAQSRFTLVTLPSSEFPSLDDITFEETITLPENVLGNLLGSTAFAMANQDVRFYLNGMLLDVREKTLRCVTTDGHRLALKETRLDNLVASRKQIIIPRKGVNEIIGLLESGDGQVDLSFGKNHLRVSRDNVVLTTKLIDGRFPDYEAAIPLNADKQITLDRQLLRGALQRAAILSNEKYRGVSLEFLPGKLRLVAHNPEQEEAVEELDTNSVLSDLSVGFNVGYLLDALASLQGQKVRLCLRDAQSSCLIQEENDEDTRHVIMPLRI